VTILGRLRHLVRQLAAWSRPPKLIDRLAGPGSEKPKAAIDGILHLLFDDAPFGLLVIDRHGRIVRANMAIPSMVGGPVDLSRGAPASLIFAEDVRDAAWAEIAPVLAGRQHAPRSFATRLHREQVETAAGDATVRRTARSAAPCCASRTSPISASWRHNWPKARSCRRSVSSPVVSPTTSTIC
jgi:PAS domain-containing protein